MEITTDRCSGSLATGAGGPGTGSAGRGFGGAGLRSRVKATRQRESWPVHDAHEDRYPFPLTPSPPRPPVLPSPTRAAHRAVPHPIPLSAPAPAATCRAVGHGPPAGLPMPARRPSGFGWPERRKINHEDMKLVGGDPADSGKILKQINLPVTQW